MIFEVVRTSGANRYNERPLKPCDEAEWSVFIEKEFLTLHLLEKWSHYDIAQWMTEGMNHQTMPDGSYVKEVKRQGWAIKINTMDDLEAFVKKYGDVVINTPGRRSEIYTLEIYDDYRE